MIVAIHQPNFFPWLGYFAKIMKAHCFVFLDQVQYPKKSAGTWINRVAIAVQGERRWLTAPINSTHGFPMISDVVFKASLPWKEKILRTFFHQYGKCSFYQQEMTWIEPLIQNSENAVAQFNANAIQMIAKHLDLDCHFIFQSELKTPAIFAQKGSTRLASICKEVGGTTYLAGDGASGYEDENAYLMNGIQLIRNGYPNPVYQQKGCSHFLPGLSVLDALFNVGSERTRHLLGTDETGRHFQKKA